MRGRKTNKKVDSLGDPTQYNKIQREEKKPDHKIIPDQKRGAIGSLGLSIVWGGGIV